MRPTNFLMGLLLVCSTMAALGQPALEWPDVVAQLNTERSQAQACANLLKAAGDDASITNGRIAYDSAKGATDGIIAGLSTALAQGGSPADLKSLNASLDLATSGLKKVCNGAIEAAKASPGHRGVIDDIVKAAIDPVADLLKSAFGALWTRHVELSNLEVQEIRNQLEAAKWPDFGS
jgi:hypothetical protein